MPTDEDIFLVTGAAGHQGGAVARQLLALDLRVRAFVHRSGTPQAEALAAAGAEVFVGDFDDPGSLAAALDDVYGVFSVQNYWPGGLENEVRQGMRVADAAKAAGVKHFIYSSVGSAHRFTGIPHFNSKWAIEKHIRDIRLPHTIFRPVFFYYNYESMRDSILDGRLEQPLSPRCRLQQLSEDEYGRIVGTAFKHPGRFLGRALDVASSEMTMPEVADAFTRVIGRQVSYHQIPWEVFEAHAGPEITQMYHWFEDVGYEADFDELHAEFGELTSLDRYLREHEWDRLPVPQHQT